MLRSLLLTTLLAGTAACSSENVSDIPAVQERNNPQPACEFASAPTTIRERDGALLEMLRFPAAALTTEALSASPGYAGYRALVERDSGDLRNPTFAPPEVEDPEMAAVWRDEMHNAAMVFDERVGVIDTVRCVDALLLARELERSEPLDQHEFVASVLRRQGPEGTEVAAVFASGAGMYVPSNFYGFDVAAGMSDDGWSLWYVIHNHPVQLREGRVVLGTPAPSTSDVGLMRSLQQTIGLDSMRVTNGFYTYRAAISDLGSFRAR